MLMHSIKTRKCAPFVVFCGNTNTLAPKRRRELVGESRFSQSEYPKPTRQPTITGKGNSRSTAAAGVRFVVCTESTHCALCETTYGRARSVGRLIGGTIRPSSEPSSSSFRFVNSRGTEWIVIQSHIGPEQTRFFVSKRRSVRRRIR